jgi:membrane fusion protein (multidrug efflux system)
MKVTHWLAIGIFGVLLTHCEPLPSSQPAAPQAGKGEAPVAANTPFEAVGRTECSPERKALISPVPLHPVVEVLVKPGDRVKKDQVLVKLDDDEPKADVKAKEAAWETTKVLLAEAQRYLKAIEPLYKSGALPEQRYHEAVATVLKGEADQRQAQHVVEGSKAELEHYDVVAQIDGVVNRLEVYVGAVSRPGTTVWGEILDLSEIDVRCDLTPDQADRLAVGQKAEVRYNGRQKLAGIAKVAQIGLAADLTTGLVPVVVRLENPDGSMRCGVAARVRFVEAKD